MTIPTNIIAAKARRPVTIGDRKFLPGQEIPLDYVNLIKGTHFRPLTEGDGVSKIPFVQVFYGASGGQRFMVPRGPGKFDVIEGKKLNVVPLSIEEARALMEPGTEQKAAAAA